jgi:murein DD-endopeptidase MepM/ murein hydrolase activator NlpD
MATFPLPFVPRFEWSGPARGKRYFGAPRPHGRLHAGCDLIAAAGTEVFAVDPGVVLYVRPFTIPYQLLLPPRRPAQSRLRTSPW